MFHYPSDVNLQTALAGANPPTDPPPAPHHPISCRTGMLWLDDAGRFGCEHGHVPADDRRTRGCIDQSISILLIELLVEKESADARR